MKSISICSLLTIFHNLICIDSILMTCISCILIVSILSKCLCIRFNKISNCYMRLIGHHNGCIAAGSTTFFRRHLSRLWI